MTTDGSDVAALRGGEMTATGRDGQPAHIVAVVPPELAPGFRLAGVETRAASDAVAAEQHVSALLAEGERGVIGVYEPYLAAFDPRWRAGLEGSVAPVVVPVPTGLAVEGEAGRRARLVARLQRAIGYHIGFGDDGS